MNALGGLRVLALLLLAAASLYIALSPLAVPLRHAVFDTYQKIFPLERETAPVRVVLIDENTIASVGQWPWPRTRLAELIEKIASYQPLAIGVDLLFPEPDRLSPGAIAAELPIMPSALQKLLEALPSNDQRLAAAIHGRDVVLGLGADDSLDPRHKSPPRAAPVAAPPRLMETIRRYPGYVGSIDVIDEAAAGRGIINSGPADRVVRQVPLVADVQGVLVASLGIETFRVALGSGVRLLPGHGGTAAIAVERYSLAMQEDGLAWLRFAPHTPDLSVPAIAVMSGEVKPEFLRDHVVLLGLSGLGLLDYKATPLGEFIPGVHIHAQVIENLFSGHSLVRPDWASLAEAGALVLAGLLLVIFIPRLTALQGIHLAFGFVVVLFGAGIVGFLHYSVLLDPAWPSIGTLAVFGSVVVGTLSETERQRRQLREQAARMAGEVDAARRIQMGLLPDPREVLGHDRRFQLAAMLEPARTVGGDFYDCFMVDARRLFIVVADVSGKGLAAALFMAAAKSHIKSAALREPQVGDILTRAQHEIAHENPEQMFVTAFAALLDVPSGMLEYSNAGHEPPFRRQPDGLPERFPKPSGPPLCVVEDYVYPSERMQLQPGEWVLVATDGATEAMNRARELFGVERLRAALSWLPREASAESIVGKVNEEVQRFAAGAEPADDLTLLALRWEGPH